MARVHEMEVPAAVLRLSPRRRALGSRFLGVLLVLFWIALWTGFISAIAPDSTRRVMSQDVRRTVAERVAARVGS